MASIFSSLRPSGRLRLTGSVGLTLALPLAVALPLSLATMSSASAAAGPAVASHGMGYVPSKVQRLVPAKLRFAAATALPASVDLTPNALPPGNQGQVGSCVSWSIVYSILGYYSNVQRHAGAPFAPMYTYAQLVRGRNVGTNPGDTWAIAADQGVAEQAVYSQGNYDYTTQPTTAQRTNAAQHKVLPFSYLFSGPGQGSSIEAPIKAALAAGQPVSLAIPVYPAFMNLSASSSTMTASMATGSLLGGHAIAGMGYNSTGVVIENSWGTSWGRSGYATLSWDFIDRFAYEATASAGFATTGVAPVVTGLSVNKGSTAGGGTMTVSGTGFATVDQTSAAAVRLVSAADPTVLVSAPVTARTGTTLTVSIPAAPVVAGSPAAGAYRVVVTNTAGASTDAGAADDFGYVAPMVTRVTGASVLPASAGGRLTLTGTGFGSSATAFTANAITATVDAKAAALTWVSDTQLSVAVPAGVPGLHPAVVLSRQGVAGTTDATAVYAATLDSRKATVDAGTGVTTLALTGRGLAGATGWTLTGPNGGSTTAALSVVAGTADLAAAASGVLITSDTAATVKLPLAPGGGAGSYALSFTPNQTTYPGAAFLPTSAAYGDYLGPAVASLSLTKASTAGGDSLVVTGTNLASVDPGSSSAVRLVNLADATKSFAATVTAKSATKLTVTLPAAASGGSPLPGSYRVVVASSLGTGPANGTKDVLALIAPYTPTVASGTKVSAGGGSVLLSGTGFGGSANDFKANLVTATVGGQTAAVTWIGDTALRVAVPAGVPGTHPSIVLLRNGIASAAVTGATYVAAVTAAGAQAGPTSGGALLTVSGVGMAGSGHWVLTGGDGNAVSLTVYGDQGSLLAAGSGVVVLSDTSALVLLPAHAAGAAVLGFTPDQSRYPGATYGATSKATITWSDLG